MSREHVKPMPTEEEKAQAQLKAKSADPLVWAMKSVDEEFPDDRKKDKKTIAAEAAVEMAEAGDANGGSDESTNDGVSGGPIEIKAEDKLTMPMGEGVVTMEVTPMRQDVSDVSPEEVKTKRADAAAAATEATGEPKTTEKKVRKVAKKNATKSDDSKTQVKLTALESRQKKMVFALAALVILALGGVTFGIVAMVRQNQTTAELENQIAATISASGKDEVDEEYIYLKDWGLKIKIVSGLTDVSYNYQTDDYAEVLIWGAKKASGTTQTPDFAKQTKNSTPLGTVVRVPRYERAAAGRLIWYDDYYNYYYQGPTGDPEVADDEMSWWVESYLLIKEMLTNADNYTSIEDNVAAS